MIVRKVISEQELPTDDGWYDTKRGRLYYWVDQKRWSLIKGKYQSLPNPEWWLEDMKIEIKEGDHVSQDFKIHLNLLMKDYERKAEVYSALDYFKAMVCKGKKELLNELIFLVSDTHDVAKKVADYQNEMDSIITYKMP